MMGIALSGEMSVGPRLDRLSLYWQLVIIELRGADGAHNLGGVPDGVDGNSFGVISGIGVTLGGVVSG